VIDEVTAKTKEELAAGLADVLRSPRGTGIVRAIVLRPAVDLRKLVSDAALDVEEGVVGDTWRSRGNRHTPDGSADPQAQVTIMNARFAELIAGAEQADWALAGDQFYVDLDLSLEHLPPGTRLRMGDAELEVSDKPHTGCEKFAARFGDAALRFVGSPEGRTSRLRGMNTRVVAGGTVRVGDGVTVVSVEPEATIGR